MPEILTSVPNGCRWHKDVLAALEVHHVHDKHQEIHGKSCPFGNFLGSFAMTSCVDVHPNFQRCSRCRPVPSAVRNAVKASQAWRWLQNRKAPCTLDEGQEGHQIGHYMQMP